MKGRLVKIYGQRDPGLEAKRIEVMRTAPPDQEWFKGIPLDDLYECTIIPPKPVVKIRIIRNFSGPSE